MTTEHLRPEAQPTIWTKMTKSQQDASKWIVTLIEEAVKAADNRPADRSRRPAWVDPSRQQSGAFLSGARGTGKSSLLLSLVDGLTGREMGDPLLNQRLNALSHRIIPCEPLDMEPLSPHTQLLPAMLARINAAVEAHVGSKSAPRGLLDDDPDESPLVQLRQFQVRVARALDGNLQDRKGSLDTDAFANEVIQHEEERLSLNIAFNEVLERLAAKVTGKQGQDARAGSEGEGNNDPLFLLPIDDLDLNPPLCADLLHLVRAIYAPRLFLLVMGDLDLARIALQLRTAQDFARISPRNVALLPISPRYFRRQIADVSTKNFQKLVPPGQRFTLRRTNLLEALAFSPFLVPRGDGGLLRERRSLAALLEAFTLPYTWYADSPLEARNLLQFLLRGSYRRFTSQDPKRPLTAAAIELLARRSRQHSLTTLPDRSADAPELGRKVVPYPAIGIFDTTLRRLADMWIQIDALRSDVEHQHGVTSDTTDKQQADWSNRMVRWLAKEIARPNFEQAVLEDPFLDGDQQIRVLLAAPTDFSYRIERGHAYADSSAVLVDYWTDRAKAVGEAPTAASTGDVSTSSGLPSEVDPRVDFYRPTARSRFSFTLGRGKDAVRISDAATLANFVFWHDLSIIHHKSGTIQLRTDLVPFHEICVAWSDGSHPKEAVIRWPGIVNWTIRSVTAFDALIKRHVAACRNAIYEHAAAVPQAMRGLLCAWVSVGCATSYRLEVASGEAADRSVWHVPEQQFLESRLAALFDRCAEVASDLSNPSAARRAKEWLERIVCLVMPECGVQVDFNQLQASLVGGVFEKYAAAHRGQLWAARHGQLQPFVKAGLVNLGNAVSNLAPATGLFAIRPQIERPVTETRLAPEQIEQLARQVSEQVNLPNKPSAGTENDVTISLYDGHLQVVSKNERFSTPFGADDYEAVLRIIFRASRERRASAKAPDLTPLSAWLGDYLNRALPDYAGSIRVDVDDSASRIPWESLRFGGQLLGLRHQMIRFPAHMSRLDGLVARPRIARSLHSLVPGQSNEWVSDLAAAIGFKVTGESQLVGITYHGFTGDSEELGAFLEQRLERSGPDECGLIWIDWTYDSDMPPATASVAKQCLELSFGNVVIRLSPLSRSIGRGRRIRATAPSGQSIEYQQVPGTAFFVEFVLGLAGYKVFRGKSARPWPSIVLPTCAEALLATAQSIATSGGRSTRSKDEFLATACQHYGNRYSRLEELQETDQRATATIAGKPVTHKKVNAKRKSRGPSKKTPVAKKAIKKKKKK